MPARTKVRPNADQETKPLNGVCGIQIRAHDSLDRQALCPISTRVVRLAYIQRKVVRVHHGVGYKVKIPARWCYLHASAME